MKWGADFNQFLHVVQLAWAFGDKERSFIIKPDNYEIPPETTAIHGITTERAIAEGVPFAEVIDEFLADAAAAPLVCVHNIYFDTSMLKANILRYCGKEYYDAKAEDALHAYDIHASLQKSVADDLVLQRVPRFLRLGASLLGLPFQKFRELP